MRRLVLLVVFGFFTFFKISFAQSEKIYVVMNEATWCKYCKAHGERVHKLMDTYMYNDKVVIVHHDMTNKETTAKSEPIFKKLKITETMARYNDTGMIFLINAKTKKTINGFNIRREDADIKISIEKALASTN
jgi:thiol-disulfide isomerase/thioredoxin